jgi:hypothetical protein
MDASGSADNDASAGKVLQIHKVCVCVRGGRLAACPARQLWVRRTATCAHDNCGAIAAACHAPHAPRQHRSGWTAGAASWVGAAASTSHRRARRWCTTATAASCRSTWGRRSHKWGTWRRSLRGTRAAGVLASVCLCVLAGVGASGLHPVEASQRGCRALQTQGLHAMRARHAAANTALCACACASCTYMMYVHAMHIHDVCAWHAAAAAACRVVGNVVVRRVAGKLHFAVHQQSFVDVLPQVRWLGRGHARADVCWRSSPCARPAPHGPGTGARVSEDAHARGARPALNHRAHAATLDTCCTRLPHTRASHTHARLSLSLSVSHTHTSATHTCRCSRGTACHT